MVCPFSPFSFTCNIHTAVSIIYRHNFFLFFDRVDGCKVQKRKSKTFTIFTKEIPTRAPNKFRHYVVTTERDDYILPPNLVSQANYLTYDTELRRPTVR